MSPEGRKHNRAFVSRRRALASQARRSLSPSSADIPLRRRTASSAIVQAGVIELVALAGRSHEPDVTRQCAGEPRQPLRVVHGET